MSEKRYPLDRPPGGMVVEPALPNNNPMSPSQTSLNNSYVVADEDLPPVTDAQGNPLPLTEFGGMEDYTEESVPPEVRQATANIPETGTLFNLAPFEQIAQLHANGQTDEARKVYDSLNDQAKYVYDNARNMDRFTAAEGARLADEFRKMQDDRTRAAEAQNDPAKRVTVAAKQAEVQEAYRQEIEYQRSLATLGDPDKSSAEQRAARLQIEALSAGIGKRINPALGTSAAAMNQAKNAVGYIGAYEYNNPLADFTSRLGTMRRNSEERMGLVRQQMEAAGVPVPEMAVPEAPPSPEDAAAKIGTMVLSQGALKDQAGNAVTIEGSPVIRYPEEGKTVFKKRGPGGGWIDLTAEEMASIGAQ